MRKILQLLVGVSVSCMAYALPLDNPALPALLTEGILCRSPCTETSFCPAPCWQPAQVRVGYYGEFVQDRRLRSRGEERNVNIHKTAVQTDAAYIALNWCDWVDLFATLGATSLRLEAPITAWGGDSGAYGFLRSDTAFSWSLGLRAVLWEWQCFTVGLEGQYLRTRPNLNNFHQEQDAILYQDTALTYQDWQVGLGIAYKVNVAAPHTWFVPYAGITWAGAKLTTHHAVEEVLRALTFYDMKNQTYFGYALGLSFIGSARWSVTGELRLVDEKALYFNTQFAF